MATTINAAKIYKTMSDGVLGFCLAVDLPRVHGLVYRYLDHISLEVVVKHVMQSETKHGQ